jgi:hypothetical protein
MYLRKLSARPPLLALLGAAALLGALLLTTGVLTTSGCNPQDDCAEAIGTTRCAGKDLQRCSQSYDESGEWDDLGLCGSSCTSESCPAGSVSLCVTNQQGMGFCAISSTPVPECASGTTTSCWLNDVVLCDTSGYVTSVVSTCGSSTCANSTFDVSFCAASTAPIPECGAGVSTACWHNQVVACDPTGYVKSVIQPCGELTCVDTPGCGPLCALDAGPNPLCSPTTASVCVDGTPTHCQCGYSVGTDLRCGSADLCQTAPLPAGGYADAGLDPGTPRTGAFCIVSSTPIPGCPSTGTYTICLGATLVQCNAGWATAETPCTGECHAYGGVGSCG